MGRENRAVGIKGENLALEFLKRKGYKIAATNLRTPFGELDIVARKENIIVFVEVKTRTSLSLGPPHISVTKLKQRSIIKNALYYLKRYGLTHSYWRIDVVSVLLGPGHDAESIELIENAVEET